MGVVLLLTACGVPSASPNAPQQMGLPAGYTTITGPMPAQMANGVRLTVNTVGVLDAPAPSGYVVLVLNLTISNDSETETVCAGSLAVVDKWANTYANWFGLKADLPEIMPMCVSTHEVATGNASFQIPVAALSQELRVRWESKLTRVEVLLPTELHVSASE